MWNAFCCRVHKRLWRVHLIATFDRRLVYVYESLKTWISTHDWYTLSYLHTKYCYRNKLYVYIKAKSLWDIVGNKRDDWKLTFKSLAVHTHNFLFDTFYITFLTSRKSHWDEEKKAKKNENSTDIKTSHVNHEWRKCQKNHNLFFLHILYSYLLHKLSIY